MGNIRWSINNTSDPEIVELASVCKNYNAPFLLNLVAESPSKYVASESAPDITIAYENIQANFRFNMLDSEASFISRREAFPVATTDSNKDSSLIQEFSVTASVYIDSTTIPPTITYSNALNAIMPSSGTVLRAWLHVPRNSTVYPTGGLKFTSGSVLRLGKDDKLSSFGLRSVIGGFYRSYATDPFTVELGLPNQNKGTCLIYDQEKGFIQSFTSNASFNVSAFPTEQQAPFASVLDVNASLIDNYYNGWELHFTSGNLRGFVFIITAYNGDTKEASLLLSTYRMPPNSISTLATSGDAYVLRKRFQVMVNTSDYAITDADRYELIIFENDSNIYQIIDISVTDNYTYLDIVQLKYVSAGNVVTTLVEEDDVKWEIPLENRTGFCNIYDAISASYSSIVPTENKIIFDSTSNIPTDISEIIARPVYFASIDFTTYIISYNFTSRAAVLASWDASIPSSGSVALLAGIIDQSGGFSLTDNPVNNQYKIIHLVSKYPYVTDPTYRGDYITAYTIYMVTNVSGHSFVVLKEAQKTWSYLIDNYDKNNLFFYLGGSKLCNFNEGDTLFAYLDNIEGNSLNYPAFIEFALLVKCDSIYRGKDGIPLVYRQSSRPYLYESTDTGVYGTYVSGYDEIGAIYTGICGYYSLSGSFRLGICGSFGGTKKLLYYDGSYLDVGVLIGDLTYGGSTGIPLCVAPVISTGNSYIPVEQYDKLAGFVVGSNAVGGQYLVDTFHSEPVGSTAYITIYNGTGDYPLVKTVSIACGTIDTSIASNMLWVVALFEDTTPTPKYYVNATDQGWETAAPPPAWSGTPLDISTYIIYNVKRPFIFMKRVGQSATDVPLIVMGYDGTNVPVVVAGHVDFVPPPPAPPPAPPPVLTVHYIDSISPTGALTGDEWVGGGYVGVNPSDSAENHYIGLIFRAGAFPSLNRIYNVNISTTAATVTAIYSTEAVKDVFDNPLTEEPIAFSYDYISRNAWFVTTIGRVYELDLATGIAKQVGGQTITTTNDIFGSRINDDRLLVLVSNESVYKLNQTYP